MKKIALLTLAAITISAPSLAFAHGNDHNNYGNNHHGYNKNEKVIVIDGPDKNHRPDVVIIKKDDNRHNYYGNNGHHNGYNNGYNGYYNGYNNHYNQRPYVKYYSPKHYNANKRCGMGSISYRLPNGHIEYDKVWMCKDYHGNWKIANR